MIKQRSQKVTNRSVGGRVHGDPLCYSCDFSVALTLCQSKKLNRKGKKKTCLDSFPLKKLFSLKDLIQMVFSKPRLFLSDCSKDASPLEADEVCLGVSRLPPDHQPFLSGPSTVSVGHFGVVPSLNLPTLIPALGQGRSSG